MFTRRCGGAELLLVLCGLDASLPCPRRCICYTAPSTVSCQAQDLRAVPEGIPPHGQRVFLQNNKIGGLLRGHLPPAAATLWLYSNNISYIQPAAFRGFRRLEELDLGDNRRLKALAADTFHGLARLRSLHLYRCGLLGLPPGIFAELHDLRYLYLQDNQLEFLEDDLFIDLLNLSHLFLHGNRLWSLHQNTFRGLGALDRLLLHQNRIRRVDQQAFHDLRRLTTLYLFNNSLGGLSAGSLALLPALEYLRLNDNPWECDCGALPLWDWLRGFRGSASSLVCLSPPQMAGKDLKMLSKEEMPTCPKEEEEGGGGGGGGAGGESANHLNRPGSRHRRPYLPHGDQRNPPPPSPRPPWGRGGNCTRPGRRAKGGADRVPLLHEPKVKDFEGKNEGLAAARRKNKCVERTWLGPPGGVQRATNAAAAPLAGAFFWSALLASSLTLRRLFCLSSF